MFIAKFVRNNNWNSKYSDFKNLSFNHYLDRLDSVDSEQIKETVIKMISQNPSLVVIGNKANLIPSLNNYLNNCDE